MTVEYIGDGSTDGTILGQSGEKIAFFAGTPSVQATLTALATDATLGTTTASVNEILAELISKGLIV